MMRSTETSRWPPKAGEVMCSTVFQLNQERECNAAKTQDLEFSLFGSTPTRFRHLFLEGLVARIAFNRLDFVRVACLPSRKRAPSRCANCGK